MCAWTLEVIGLAEVAGNGTKALMPIVVSHDLLPESLAGSVRLRTGELPAEWEIEKSGRRLSQSATGTTTPMAPGYAIVRPNRSRSCADTRAEASRANAAAIDNVNRIRKRNLF